MRLTTVISIAVILAVILTTSPSAFAEGEVSISTHWKRPVTISGKDTPPYLPTDCAKCHPDKLKEWQGSLHSVTVGPGLLAQLSPKTNFNFARSCYYCHAPAAEQQEFLKTPDGGYETNPDFDARLRATGVSCAVCHMREGIVYGPPGPSAPVSSTVKGSDGHRSVEAEFFGSAEFCAKCHQLDGGFQLAGKVLTNTYNEWKESTYGKNNIPCQTCHMPEKRHLWRGIHDKEMTLGALSIEVGDASTEGGKVRAAVKVTNVGAGHYFPTYVTPTVVVRGVQLDGAGEAVKGSEKRWYIGRKVAQDLSVEYFDTRIAPEESSSFDYDEPLKEGSVALLVEFTVFPDDFYNKFFKGRVESGYGISKMAELTKALEATSSSSYLLYKKELPLK